MAKKPALCFFFFLLFLPFLSQAQPTQNARAEIPVNNDNRNFYVWPLPDSTVIVLHAERSFRRNAEPFSIFKYNQHLSLIWQKPVNVPPSSLFLQGINQKKVCFLIFEGQKKEDILLARVQAGTGNQQISHHKLPENMTFKLTGVQVLEGFLFLTG